MERILVINPGSTSTKVAVFEDETKIMSETLRHEDSDLAPFDWVVEQVDYRKGVIMGFLKDQNFDVKTLTCVMARGGQVPPVLSGAYPVDKKMVDYLGSLREGSHVSNIACIIGYDIGKELDIPVYIYDPVCTDELSPIARICGMPQAPKQSRGHSLNAHAVARRCARDVLNKPVEDCTFVVAHLGGGCSVWLMDKGVSTDIYSDDDGPFSPERCGRVQAMELVSLCYSGKYSYKEVSKLIRGNAGIRALLGTSDMRDVESRIENGDEKAKLVYDAFIYNMAKAIGDLCTAVKGKVDRIVLTGGIAHSKKLTDAITDYVSFLAPVIVIAGEYEMEALAEGGLRVLRGEEQPKAINWPE